MNAAVPESDASMAYSYQRNVMPLVLIDTIGLWTLFYIVAWQTTWMASWRIAAAGLVVVVSPCAGWIGIRQYRPACLHLYL